MTRGAFDDEALQALAVAVEMAPQSAPLRVHLVRALLAAARPGDAAAHCDVLLTGSPDDPEVLLLAADVAEAVGDMARASRLRGMAAVLTAHPAEGAPPSGKPPAGADPGHAGSGSVRTTATLSVVGGGGDDGDLGAERPNVTLADVGGMEQVKRRLQAAFLAPLRDAALRQAFGKSLRGGLLLYGPPGCGKTFIARATAGELAARFISVGLTDVLDPYWGRSEQALHDIFVRARQKAPCVLFFDEIDALGQRRALVRDQSFARRLAAQFLTELDGIDSHNDGLFVLAATNHPWDVDPALRRPGRFDRMLLVLPPDQPARETILRSSLAGRPVAARLDVDRIASATDQYSGADLVHLVETAAERALLASIEGGSVRPIDGNDLHEALAEVRSSTGGWFQQARQHALFANEGGMYDELLTYINAHGLA